MRRTDFSQRIGIALVVLIASCTDSTSPRSFSRNDPTVAAAVIPPEVTLFQGAIAATFLRELAVDALNDGKPAMRDFVSQYVDADPATFVRQTVGGDLRPRGNLIPRSANRDVVTDAINNTPNSGWQAVVLAKSTAVDVGSGSGSAGFGSAVLFFGTHGSNTITYSVTGVPNITGTVLPMQQGNDHANWIACVGGPLALATCSWTDEFTSGGSLDFGGHTCGVTVAAHGQHQAWFNLPGISASMSGVSVSSSFTTYGASDIATDAGSNDTNGNCTPDYYDPGGGGDGPGGDACGGSGTYEWFHWNGSGYQDMGEVCGYQIFFGDRIPTQPTMHLNADLKGKSSGMASAPITLVRSRTVLQSHVTILRRAHLQPADILVVDDDATPADFALAVGSLNLLRSIGGETLSSDLSVIPRGRLSASTSSRREAAKLAYQLTRLRKAPMSQIDGIGRTQSVQLFVGPTAAVHQ